MFNSSMRAAVALAGLVLAVAVAPTSLLAQQQDGPRLMRTGVSASVATSASVPRSIGASIDASISAASSASTELVPPQDQSMGNGTNVAMMIVGATALIVGLSVGGDGGQIIAVSGSVIGLIGLFRYLR